MDTVDVTGVILTPGKPQECRGNGQYTDEHGDPIECCCDECDYLMQCIPPEKDRKVIGK